MTSLKLNKEKQEKGKRGLGVGPDAHLPSGLSVGLGRVYQARRRTTYMTISITDKFWNKIN